MYVHAAACALPVGTPQGSPHLQSEYDAGHSLDTLVVGLVTQPPLAAQRQPGGGKKGGGGKKAAAGTEGTGDASGGAAGDELPPAPPPPASATALLTPVARERLVSVSKVAKHMAGYKPAVRMLVE